jgi:hypothetical protein
LLIAIAVALLLALGAGSAGAASDIEGIWSFNGGQIGVQRLANGAYVGTVVVATKFAECTHEVGEPIWTGITEQPDGSYQGLHQWFFPPPACAKNPVLGPTAWRILREANGSHYLRVCFSHPGDAQPTITADGSDSGTTYGCTNSALTALLPLPQGSGVAGSKESLVLPSARKCLSARLFKIHLADPTYDPLKIVTVTLRGRKLATSRHGKFIVAIVNLRNLPRGAFTIKIRATTVLGHHLSSNRTYHTCTAKIKLKKRGKKG